MELSAKFGKQFYRKALGLEEVKSGFGFVLEGSWAKFPRGNMVALHINGFKVAHPTPHPTENFIYIYTLLKTSWAQAA